MTQLQASLTSTHPLARFAVSTPRQFDIFLGKGNGVWFVVAIDSSAGSLHNCKLTLGYTNI